MMTDIPTITSRVLDITLTGNVTEIRFKPDRLLTAGSERRARQAVQIVRSALRRLKNRRLHEDGEGITAQIVEADDVAVESIVATIDHKLDDLGQEPLTAKMAEEILGITSRERVRWSKDGRLPNVGKASFRRGQNRINLFTYSPTAIAELAAAPEVIAKWRTMDGAAPEHDAAHESRAS